MSVIQNELPALIAILLVTAGVVVEFPREAIGFKGRSDLDSRQTPRPIFLVTLDSESEGSVMRMARNVLKNGSGGRWICTDLFLSDLPAGECRPLLTIESRSRPPSVPVATRGMTPYLPSLRASPPPRIQPEEAVDTLPFPRSELLKID